MDITIFGSSAAYGFSGWDLYSDVALIDQDALVTTITVTIQELELTSYTYVPLVALLCGIIGLIATILPVACGNKMVNKLFGILSLLLAVVSIILMVLYITDLSYEGGVSSIAAANVGASYGVYLGFVGAVLMVLGGIGDFARKTN